MNDWKIIDFVTEVFKTAEGKKFATHPSRKYNRESRSEQLRIVLNIGRTIYQCNARLEDENGILGNYYIGHGFAQDAKHSAYILK